MKFQIKKFPSTVGDLRYSAKLNSPQVPPERQCMLDHVNQSLQAFLSLG